MKAYIIIDDEAGEHYEGAYYPTMAEARSRLRWLDNPRWRIVPVTVPR